MDTNKIIIKQLIKSGAKAPAELAKAKRKIAKKYKTSCPSNIELLKVYHKMKKSEIRPSANLEVLLRTRPIRSLSGIVNVSVLTKPYPCPGKCIYCPNQKEAPKSYLKNEPAVMRAILNQYDPYRQTQCRLKALELTGHFTDKIELRIIGGTWSYYPKNYQGWFIKRCFEACNAISRTKPTIGAYNRNLAKAQKENETANHRLVGISIETRPDFINPPEIKRLRRLGVTMVELGVQSIYDDVLRLNKRGHKVRSTITATKLLKDAGFKVLYQMMPNLPGSNLKRDRAMFKEIFTNPDFQPDYLKIYPTAILKGTLLYKLWREKKYGPYSKKDLINLIRLAKSAVPYYVRIQRITRDIPSQSIAAGPAKISNLRQMIAGQIKNRGEGCRCIRCREVRKNYNPREKLFLFRQDYDASDGKEIFLSYEDKSRKKLYGLLRLRVPNQSYRQPCKKYHENASRSIIPVLKNGALIREVHIYGQLHPLNEGRWTSVISPQHKGLGRKLIQEAEKIAKKEHGLKKIAVISGVGVRNYYRKLGYKLKDTYMIKRV